MLLPRTSTMPQARSRSSQKLSVTVPVIVAGEFAFGIAQSRHRAASERSLNRLLDRCLLLDLTRDTARHYAAIRLELKTAVTPIPSNDLSISRDTHFERAAGLSRRTW